MRSLHKVRGGNMPAVFDPAELRSSAFSGRMHRRPNASALMKRATKRLAPA